MNNNPKNSNMEPSRKTAMALGFFDGVHLGHAALINKVLERAEQGSMNPAVLSFDVHPDNLVTGRKTSLIFDSAEKKAQLRELFGIDDVIFLRFTDDLRKMHWLSFLDLLVERFNVGGVVAGHDFSFGYKGEGKAENLKEYCAEHGLLCDIIPPVYLDGQLVSSTEIRSRIGNGDIAGANRLLGHPYYIPGTVIHGLHNGTRLGFPTMNIKMPQGLVTPPFGVYSSLVDTGDGSLHPAATDIGVKPTVCDDGEPLVESFLLDFSGNIYGRNVRVYLKSFIRPERKFSGFSELEQAIARDIDAVRSDLQTYTSQSLS